MGRSGNNRLLIAFYGDDFTGSTDALEFLSRSGIKTVLFIESPSETQLAHYPELQAIGIAGMTRMMSPDDMQKELQPAFRALQQLNPRHVHYKVCSTFDSSPVIGSIGTAIDIGCEIFQSGFVPLLVAAPILGRYCLFGNLFARMGIGSNGTIYRLDRHPSMSRHPVTPADESDLRLHLGKQTTKKTGLFDILALHKYRDETADTLQNPTQQNSAELSELVQNGNEIILFDALEQEDLVTIGALIDGYAAEDQIIFSAGSSGIEMALGAYWQQNRTVRTQPEWKLIQNTAPVLVVSGSCSPVTASQIAYALKNGFAEIAMDTAALANIFSSSAHPEVPAGALLEIATHYAEQASEFIRKGINVLIHTSLGNDDERVLATDKLLKEKDIARSATALVYGNLLGQIASITAAETDLQRIIIAGGDTSSHVARAMGIEAVEMIAPLSPGAPLCLAHAPGTAADQLQIVFKGGQVGKEDLFVMAAQNIIPEKYKPYINN